MSAAPIPAPLAPLQTVQDFMNASGPGHRTGDSAEKDFLSTLFRPRCQIWMSNSKRNSGSPHHRQYFNRAGEFCQQPHRFPWNWNWTTGCVYKFHAYSYGSHSTHHTEYDFLVSRPGRLSETDAFACLGVIHDIWPDAIRAVVRLGSGEVEVWIKHKSIGLPELQVIQSCGFEVRCWDNNLGWADGYPSQPAAIPQVYGSSTRNGLVYLR